MDDFRANKRLDKSLYLPFLTKRGYVASINLKVGDQALTGCGFSPVISKRWVTGNTITCHSKGGVRRFPVRSKVLARDSSGQVKMFTAQELMPHEHEIGHVITKSNPEVVWDLDPDMHWFLGRFIRNGSCLQRGDAQQFRVILPKRELNLVGDMIRSTQSLVQIDETGLKNFSVKIVNRKFRAIAEKIVDHNSRVQLPYEFLTQPSTILSSILEGVWCSWTGSKASSKITVSDINRGYGLHAAQLRSRASMGSLWMSKSNLRNFEEDRVNIAISSGRRVKKGYVDQESSVVWVPIDSRSFKTDSTYLQIEVRNQAQVCYENSWMSY